MNNKETRPFGPYITNEQICAFDKARPETSTGSALVDTVLSLFDEPGFRTASAIGRYLELDPDHISAYLLIATGHKLAALRRLWTLHRYEQLRRRYASNDELAQALGFKDHSSLWYFLHADEHNRKQNKERREIRRRTIENFKPHNL